MAASFQFAPLLSVALADVFPVAPLLAYPIHNAPLCSSSCYPLQACVAMVHGVDTGELLAPGRLSMSPPSPRMPPASLPLHRRRRQM
ncbi:hypothetical protein TRIUR3_14528 [Triticum urartu]|uniref:Secreted protein n=1 Tax=Triticum urartu TaxID=4572 RepID=M7YR75_TRIUA|nr:hypothetical protein TRIUR3_14528 [Triticum urartu]